MLVLVEVPVSIIVIVLTVVVSSRTDTNETFQDRRGGDVYDHAQDLDKHQSSFSVEGAIACVKSIACVIKLVIVCDDKAARMRREALGYSRICQKQLMDGADDVISFKSGRRHGAVDPRRAQVKDSMRPNFRVGTFVATSI